jgi:hypothetical protein
LLSKESNKESKMTELEFLSETTIVLKKIPKYVEFEGVFIEPIDYRLCKMIVDKDNRHLCVNAGGKALNTQMIKNLQEWIVDPKQSQLKKKSPLPLNKDGRLSVTHFQSVKFLGRYYPTDNHSLIPLTRPIKHTIMHYMKWIDLDMVEGHPSIAIAMFDKLLDLSALKEYVTNFDERADHLSAFYAVSGDVPVDKDNIKFLFNMMLYGGSPDTWVKELAEEKEKIIVRKDHHQFVIDFKKECNNLISMIYTTNPDMKKKLRRSTEHETKNRVASYFYMIIENHLVYLMYNWLVKEGAMEKRHCALEYDGLCFPPKEGLDLDTLVPRLNKHIEDVTGMAIAFKYKKYDESTILMKLIDERIRKGSEEGEEDEDEEEEGRPKKKGKSNDDEEGSQRYKQYLEFDVRTHIGAMMFLIKGNENKFIWVKDKEDKKGELYSWTGKRWETGTLEFVRFISTVGVKMLEDIKARAREELGEGNELLKIIETNITWALKDFKNRNNHMNIINSSEAFLTNQV